MSGNLFVMDARVPVDPSIPTDDPSHPENITKKTLMLERQAHADSKYDLQGPIRESFSMQQIDPRILFVLALLIASIAIGCAVCCRFKQYSFEFRIACAVVAVGALHYAIAAFK
jgi:hypothetical protein